jgi:hypothetical protein
MRNRERQLSCRSKMYKKRSELGRCKNAYAPICLCKTLRDEIEKYGRKAHGTRTESDCAGETSNDSTLPNPEASQDQRTGGILMLQNTKDAACS